MIKKFIPKEYNNLRLKKITSITLLLLLLGLSPAWTSEKIDGDTLKAIYLYQFANFIKWPKSSFETKYSPIRFCLVDDGPLMTILPKVLTGQSINNRPLVYEKLNIRHTRVEQCHLLFIHNVYNFHYMFKNIRNLPILTVADNDFFLKEGGIIALTEKNNRIKPMINIQRMEQQKLKASSKLLRLSIIYKK